MRSLIPAWRASPETTLRLTIALGSLLLWLLVEYFIVSDALRGGTQARQALAANARQATAAKAREMSQVLNDIYVGTRTISLLPAVRGRSRRTGLRATPTTSWTADVSLSTMRRRWRSSTSTWPRSSRSRRSTSSTTASPPSAARCRS